VCNVHLPQESQNGERRDAVDSFELTPCRVLLLLESLLLDFRAQVQLEVVDEQSQNQRQRDQRIRKLVQTRHGGCWILFVEFEPLFVKFVLHFGLEGDECMRLDTLLHERHLQHQDGRVHALEPLEIVWKVVGVSLQMLANQQQ